MVLDPFTSISLAGNICNFVDASCKLFRTTLKIHHSTSGLQSTHEALEALTVDFQNLCSNLRWPLHRPPASIEEQRLKTLAEQCESAAIELLTSINKLKAKDPSSRWSSFRSALKTIWKQEEIEEMQRRLDSYRAELVLRLQAIRMSASKL
jgi:hypothetical protein